MSVAAGTSAVPYVRPADRPQLVALAVAAIALCALRIVMAADTGFVDDEAYYRIWSLAPALSYYDHPPMIAWIIALGRAIAGDSTFGARFLAPVLHLAGIGLIWRTADILYGSERATRAAWMLLAMPLVSLGGILVTPDLPSVFFAGLVFWTLAELDRSGNMNWWLATGFFAGCGFLSKYTNLFLGATILIWLLAVPRNRKWFGAPQLWIGGLIAAAVASPVFIWNTEHNWVSFAKQFGRVGESMPGGPRYLLEFVLVYVGLASPVIAVLSAIGLLRVTQTAIKWRTSKDVLLAATVLPMLCYFTVHGLHDRVQGNWLAPAYPPLALCAAIGLEAISIARQRMSYISALAVGFAITGLIFAHAHTPLLTFYNLRREPTQEMRGWDRFGDAIDRLRKEKGAAWVATTSYAVTGQLAFALKGRSEVIQIDERIRYAYLPDPPRSLTDRPALYVVGHGKADLRLIGDRFRSVVPLPGVERDVGRGESVAYDVFLVGDPIKSPVQ